MAYGIVHFFAGGTKEQYRRIPGGGTSRSGAAARANLSRRWPVGWWLDSVCDPRVQGELGALP